MKKLFCVLCAAVLALGCFGCKQEETPVKKNYGPNYKVENETADAQYLYGMCNLAWQEPGIDPDVTAQLVANMGVKSVRMWMHCNWLMTDPNTMNAAAVAKMKAMLSKLASYDLQIIGMNHSNFHDTSMINGAATTAKPGRDLSEGSAYMQWLEGYEATWYNLAKTFPEVLYWEIDNECNNDDFMPKLGGGKFTLSDKAAVYTDMMFFASRGIHAANPAANTVMGGIVGNNCEAFMEYVYENIEAPDSWSKYPDDYFQIACWHPYIHTNYTDEKFRAFNQGIYDVILKHEGKDKKVFCSEMGWSQANVTAEQVAEWLPRAYAVALELGFIESIHYFRLYDVWSSDWGSPAEKQFGLFTDPLSHGPTIDGVSKNPILGAPKASALAYQAMAGGSGSLELLVRA